MADLVSTLFGKEAATPQIVKAMQSTVTVPGGITISGPQSSSAANPGTQTGHTNTHKKSGPQIATTSASKARKAAAAALKAAKQSVGVLTSLVPQVSIYKDVAEAAIIAKGTPEQKEAAIEREIQATGERVVLATTAIPGYGQAAIAGKVIGAAVGGIAAVTPSLTKTAVEKSAPVVKNALELASEHPAEAIGLLGTIPAGIAVGAWAAKLAPGAAGGALFDAFGGGGGGTTEIINNPLVNPETPGVTGVPTSSPGPGAGQSLANVKETAVKPIEDQGIPILAKDKVTKRKKRPVKAKQQGIRVSNRVIVNNRNINKVRLISRGTW